MRYSRAGTTARTAHWVEAALGGAASGSTQSAVRVGLRHQF
jgi:predicted porin